MVPKWQRKFDQCVFSTSEVGSKNNWKVRQQYFPDYRSLYRSIGRIVRDAKRRRRRKARRKFKNRRIHGRVPPAIDVRASRGTQTAA